MNEQQGLPGIDTARTVANPNDLWMTPDWLAAEFVAWCHIDGQVVLEPSAGTGQLVRELRAQGARGVLAFELDPEWAERGGFACGDFLVSELRPAVERALYTPGLLPEVTVGNPPFSLMLEFIERALAWTPRVCMILPVSVFFGKNEKDPGQSRHRLWTSVAHPTRVRVLSARPRFVGAKDTSPATDFLFMEIARGGTPKGTTCSVSIEWA